MKNNVIITEDDLKNIIRESVERIIRENQEEEGFWDNMKSAFKGARQGYNTQKAVDTDVKTGYSRNTRMSPNEAPSNDAAEKVRQYYAIAKDYLTKYNQMKAKADAIAKQYGIKSTSTGLNKNFDYDVSTEFNGKRPRARQQHANYTTKASIKGNQPQNNAWKAQQL